MKIYSLIFIAVVKLIADTNIYLDSSLEFKKKGIYSWVELKNKNLSRQKYDYSCGSASLATILKYFYNQDIDEKFILKEILKRKKDKSSYRYVGLSFFDLENFVRKIGFRAIGLSVNIDSLRNLKIPVILYIRVRDDSHFTVFKGMSNNFVYLADPSFGNIKIRLSKFKEMFYLANGKSKKGRILAIVPMDKRLRSNKDFFILKKNTNLYKVLMFNQVFN
jgi:predicted double-glycine peptidase